MDDDLFVLVVFLFGPALFILMVAWLQKKSRVHAILAEARLLEAKNEAARLRGQTKVCCDLPPAASPHLP